jgi:Predicted membrane protein
MNPDKPLPDEPSQDIDPAVDFIPILDEALDLPAELGEHGDVLSGADEEANFNLHDTDTPAETGSASDPSSSSPQDLELSVDLGYAAEQEEYVENDDLAEMDEIQTLPLAEMVLDDSQDMLVSNEHKQQIATLEAIVFEGENPNAPAPRKPSTPEAAEPAQPSAPQPAEPAQDATAYTPPSPPPLTPPFTPPPGKPLPTKSDNPFLPQHILDRLNQGKRNLVEEIAQSSAALDASTAILRTHARAERLAKPAYSDSKPQYSFSRDKSTLQKQKMVDDLVEEYLPLLAAELRRRLRKMLDE